MKIQPISSWQNGQEVQGTEFNLTVINDNLSTAATFYFTITTDPETDIPTSTVANGNLTMDGEDYQTWDSSVSANEWAYNWAATQLNLVIVPNQIVA